MTLPDTFPDEPPYQMFCVDVPPSSVSNLCSLDASGEVRSKTQTKFKLADIYSAFVHNVEKYRPLRRMLRDLDENTWVLDPPDGPARKNLENTSRRIAISKGISLQVDLDPNVSMNELPGLKFLGADDKVRPLRDVLSRNLERYDPDYTLVQNLERVLEVEFPQQQDCMEEQVNNF